ncbi:transposase [Sporolactobacillus sp. Y61]|uniref:Transposase n=1 Tax=Sporolactobacillus sp. Y61 TaxID=3160863 RepID=A0AAU8IIL4_9BACL|nr:RNA-guided endonuclease TnpB family protein [Sporolactobacillus sp. THM19-2]RYL89254.1 transposase [Sporolactobacillus sp. THM19-2]
MNIGLSLKLKLKVTSDQAERLKTLMMIYRNACNEVSHYYFDHHFRLNQVQLHDRLYNKLRRDYALKSQAAQSVLLTVLARYRSVRTQLSHERVQNGWKLNTNGNPLLDTKGHPIPVFTCKTLDHLWKPIQFARPQADLVFNRDYSFLSDGTLSLNTMGKRIKVSYSTKGFKQYLNQDWKLGTAKLVQRRGKFFLHIGATKEVPDFETQNVKHVAGLDRGLRFLVTGYDEKGKTLFINGKEIMHTRSKYKKLRGQLQAKGTYSAKRRLRKIGQREKRWMADINHQISKALVAHYGANTLFTLEDLTGVRFATEKVSKDRRYEQVSWAFYQLEQFLTYKARLNQSEVIKVDAHYTSQRCPKCGKINKDHRRHETHEYVCENCGTRSNDDRIGAMNIQLLGTQYVSGVAAPHFEKD